MNKDRPVKVLPGFEHINRYWDPHMGVWAAKILPGEFYVSTQGEMVVTVLGSCISACIRDRIIGVGGMNHFMLPVSSETGSWNVDSMSSATRYGNWAMEYLINAILKAGGRKENLEIKLFGGGQVLANMTDVGKRNIEFAFNYIAREHLQVTNHDVGDVYPRKVLYFSDTGAVKLRKLKTSHNQTVQVREERYRADITKKPTTGSIELF